MDSVFILNVDEIATAAADKIVERAEETTHADLRRIIRDACAPLAEQRDRLLVHLKHLMAYAVSNDPGDVMQGYTIRLDAMYRNTLVAECEKEKR